MTQNVHVRVRFEEQSFWATVDEYPGVFGTGDNLDELRESLEEGLALVIHEADPETRPVRLSPLPEPLPADAADMVARTELTFA